MQAFCNYSAVLSWQESDSSCANNTKITEIKTNTITHKKSELHVSGIKQVCWYEQNLKPEGLKPESKGKQLFCPKAGLQTLKTRTILYFTPY